jgi:cell division protein FtsZ
VDEAGDGFGGAQGPIGGIASALRGRSGGGTTAEPARPDVADFGNDSSYLDIPAFLRRQAD